MRWMFLPGLLAGMALSGAEMAAPVTGAMIFSDGIAAVRRTVDAGEMTEFDLALTIQPMAGTLWFSDPVVSVVRREVKAPAPEGWPISDYTKTFAGKTVTLFVAAGSGDREISGTVWDPDPREGPVAAANLYRDTVWLKQPDGKFEMVSRHLIRGIRCTGAPQAAPRTVKHPVWHFTLSKAAQKPLNIDFLTGGLAWENAYCIELLDGKRMAIRQDAEIVNNLSELKNVDLYLAGGSAGFVNRGRTSPMAMIRPGKHAGAGVRPVNFREMNGRNINMLADCAAAEVPVGFGVSATGESADISLVPLRNFSLGKGEVCHRTLGRAECSFERLVHWAVRARRNADSGRVVNSNAGTLMDALRFTNPFDRPLTAAPAEILDGGVVLSQIRVPWVNPGAEKTLDIMPALSLTGKVLEYEVAAQKPELVESLIPESERLQSGKKFLGKRYRVTDVQGELRLKNDRKTAAKVQIDLDYAGVLVSAEGKPGRTMLDSTGSLNPSSRLCWDLKLGAGEEKVIRYRYCLLAAY